MESRDYNYLSSILICGERSPKASQYKVFNLDILKKQKDLAVKVSKTPKGESRFVSLTGYSTLRTVAELKNRTQNFAPIITFRDDLNRIDISDSVFNNLEFDIYDKDIKALIDRKILATGTLLEALYTRDVSSFPLIINDFPNISKVILDKYATIFK